MTSLMSPPLKVLFVARSTSGHSIGGGMERVYESLARYLVGSGVEVSVVTTPGFDPEKLSINYSHIWEISGGRPGKYSIFWWIRTFRGDKRWVKWKPDVVFSVSSAAGSICFRRWARGKIIGQCHGTAFAEVQSSIRTLGPWEVAKLPINFARIVREALTYRRFALVVAIGAAVQKQLVSRPISLDSARVELIPNGVDELPWRYSLSERTRFRKRMNIPDGASVAIVSSRLHKQKGVDIAIRAHGENVNSRDCYLLICGSGPELMQLRALADQLDVSESTYFLGSLNQEDLSSAMSAADVLLFPTRREEGLPLTVLEALANGLAVITVKNAQVPPELREHVVVVNGTAEEFALTWASLPEAPRKSKLSHRFTLNASLDAYTLLIDNMAEKKSEVLGNAVG